MEVVVTGYRKVKVVVREPEPRVTRFFEFRVEHRAHRDGDGGSTAGSWLRWDQIGRCSAAVAAACRSRNRLGKPPTLPRKMPNRPAEAGPVLAAHLTELLGFARSAEPPETAAASQALSADELAAMSEADRLGVMAAVKAGALSVGQAVVAAKRKVGGDPVQAFFGFLAACDAPRKPRRGVSRVVLGEGEYTTAAQPGAYTPAPGDVELCWSNEETCTDGVECDYAGFGCTDVYLEVVGTATVR